MMLMNTPQDVAAIVVTNWLGELCALFQAPRYFLITTPRMSNAVNVLSALSYMRPAGDKAFVSSVDNIGNPLIMGSGGGGWMAIGGEFTREQQQELLRLIHNRYSYEACSLNPDDFSNPKDKRKAAEERKKNAEAYNAKNTDKVSLDAGPPSGSPPPGVPRGGASGGLFRRFKQLFQRTSRL